MHPRTIRIGALLVTALATLAALAAPARAQDAPEAPSGPSAGDDLPPARPPPELTASQRGKLDRALKKLRNSNAERRAATEAKIVAFGRGAIPHLVDAAHTDHEGKRTGLVRCLVDLAGVDDRDLVADCMDAEHVTLRRFAVEAAGELGLPPLLDALPARLDDADEVVSVRAALALVANGREEGLGRLVDAWDGPWRDDIAAALPGVVGRGPHALLVARLRSDPEEERLDPEGEAARRLSAVQMLHAVGDAVAVRALRTALDDTHNLVQRAAIDALRDLLEDQPPLQAGSIFEQIREVERLKALK